MLDSIEPSNWNEYNVKNLTRTNWRASLVPAAAVIPAPIAYIKVVAVKKLVVGFGGVKKSDLSSVKGGRGATPLEGGETLWGLLEDLCGALYCGAAWSREVYFEKIRVFKAGY
jgi:hypothetical protein